MFLPALLREASSTVDVETSLLLAFGSFAAVVSSVLVLEVLRGLCSLLLTLAPLLICSGAVVSRVLEEIGVGSTLLFVSAVLLIFVGVVISSVFREVGVGCSLLFRLAP